jgi:hypothetical protein
MLHLVEHPLSADELTKLKEPRCPSPGFRQSVRRIASMMVPAVTANFETTVAVCNTPLEITSGVRVKWGGDFSIDDLRRFGIFRRFSRFDSPSIRAGNGRVLLLSSLDR